jgi:hypothetical protein
MKVHVVPKLQRVRLTPPESAIAAKSIDLTMNNANESVDVLSPLIVNPGTNDHYGAPSTIGTPSRIGTPWFRQVSSEFSERWSHHVGSIGYLGSLSIAVK